MSTVVPLIHQPLPANNIELQGRVVAYLNSRGFHAFRQLDVTAAHGEISVAGALRSYHERQVAIESIRRVAGVSRVIDRITVDEAGPGGLSRPKASSARVAHSELQAGIAPAIPTTTNPPANRRPPRRMRPANVQAGGVIRHTGSGLPAVPQKQELAPEYSGAPGIH